jgi:predicted dehydrogenase
MRPLRLGVVGLGEGRSVLSAALSSNFWEIANVCDVNEELCRRRLQEFGLQRYTTRFDDLLADDGIDVIGIYTPDPLHADHLVGSLDAGKHVICTKPLFDSLERAREVYDLWAKSGTRVLVGHSSRFFEPMIRQRRDFEAGKHGEIVCVESSYHADYRWYLERSWAKGGAIKWLYTGLSHCIDLVRWYVPGIDEVMGYGRVSPGGAKYGLTRPDTMQVVMMSASGVIARVGGSYCMPPCKHAGQAIVTCTVRGQSGSSLSQYPNLCYLTNFDGEDEACYSYEDMADYYFRFEGHTHHAGEYQNYLDYFAACLERNQAPRPDLADGIGTVAVAAAVEESWKTGRPVRVAEILRSRGLESLVGSAR